MAKQSPTDIRQYRRRKRRAGNFRWVLITIFLLSCSCGGYFFSLSPFFAVEQITISGNSTVQTERLRDLAGIETGQNIFTVEPRLVERWLAMEPLVASAKVERRLPRTVAITVSERQAAAVLATGTAFVQVDNTGLVLRRLRELDTSSLPILTGVSDFPPGIIPGSRIEGEEMQVALVVLTSLPEQAFQNVTEIDVTDSQKIKLYLIGGVEVRLGGSQNIAEKYVMADNIIYDAQVNGKAANIGYVDISSTEKPVIYYYK